jgi:hypothetical protein
MEPAGEPGNGQGGRAARIESMDDSPFVHGNMMRTSAMRVNAPVACLLPAWWQEG